MTHQEIGVFLAVVRTGSMSGAVQALYITQPAVGRHIRTLERELGCPLLTRAFLFCLDRELGRRPQVEYYLK